LKRYVLRREPDPHLPKEAARPSDAGTRGSATGADASRGWTAGERAYLKIVEEESRREIPQDVFERKQTERRLLMDQSLHIADMLESVGIRAYGDSKLTMVGLLSGIEEPLVDFLNIVFIPAVAKRKRNKILGDLEYFLQTHPYARMWVFTSGSRCRIGEVSVRIREVHRRISKLNSKPFMKAAGITIEFRATELGSLQRVDGVATFHIHCHAIIDLQRKLSRDSWSLLLGKVREWWQFHFADAKKIQMAREACKYVVKPGDLLGLTGEELKALHEQLFKLHLVQALGTLRNQRKEREDTDMRFHRVKSSMGSKLERIPNWNTRPALGGSAGGSKPKPDTVLATLVPAPYFSRITEPAAIVLNRSKESIRERSLKLRKIWAAACGEESVAEGAIPSP
jgi:hypothetical protein